MRGHLRFFQIDIPNLCQFDADPSSETTAGKVEHTIDQSRHSASVPRLPARKPSRRLQLLGRHLQTDRSTSAKWACVSALKTAQVTD